MFDSVKGHWIASDSQNDFIIGYENGEYIHLNSEGPIHLFLNDDGRYALEFDNYKEYGTYTANEKKVTLMKSDGLITENCELKKENELHCNKYASLYIKQKNDY